jgi:hypothetical protein
MVFDCRWLVGHLDVVNFEAVYDCAPKLLV